MSSPKTPTRSERVFVVTSEMMKVQTAAILVHDIFATEQFTTVIVTMSEADNVKRDERPPVPAEFFKYYGSAEKARNSLYQCLKCPTAVKKISCSDKSRLNLKKHIEVRCLPLR